MRSPCSSRRAFLRLTGLGALGVGAIPASVGAVQPFQRAGMSRLWLSLAAYSFRDALQAGKMDLFQFVDFCADHGCVGAELTSYYFPKGVDDAFLLRLKRHAFLRGVAVSGTAVGNTFTLPPGPKRDAEIAGVKAWIDRAVVLGAPHIRVFAGVRPKEATEAEAVGWCVECLEEVGAYAARRGVWLGVENHGGIVAEPGPLISLLRAVKSDWVGINLDSGNFHGRDPYAQLEEIAPYAVNVQVKGEIRRESGPLEPSDLNRVVSLLRKSGYQGFVALEYESKEDPFTGVPRLLKALQQAMG